jgi:SAM-dependent methyltransferase
MEYIGGELELFAAASNWKSYVAAQLAPYIEGRVLEVGAGIGGNILTLCGDRVTHYLALEPDDRLAAVIQRRLDDGELPATVSVMRGTLARLTDEKFDTILYVDVLEHIAEDRAELAHAARHLASNGHLIVLSPAHQYLFSPFDRAIGHVRRYSRSGLAALTPAACRIARVRMLDSAGFGLSLGNRLLLRASMPTQAQIRFWDRVIVRISRLTDRLSGFRFGKSILMIWRSDTRQE